MSPQLENAVALPRAAAVVGLGLMGGSLARDLASRGTRVLVHDSRPDIVTDAIATGVAYGTLGDSLADVGTVDLVILATPVDAALETLAQLRPYLSEQAILTDVGSTKRTIQDRVTELGLADRFVGAHPFAGDHRSGWHASRIGLYGGKTVFLCPTPTTRPAALSFVQDFWQHLGARPVVLDAAEHDERMAWLSHLPQLMSSALATTLCRAELSNAELGPGGRDCTRLAASSPEMWTAICMANVDNISTAINAYRERLQAIQDALRDGDHRALNAFFEEARRWSV